MLTHKILGYLILTALFVGVFIFMGREIGWKTMATVIFGYGSPVGLTSLAFYLITH